MHTWNQPPLDLLERVISAAAYMSKVRLLRWPWLTLIGIHSLSPDLMLGLLLSSLSASIDVACIYTFLVWHHVSIFVSVAIFIHRIASQD